ncbi:MAG: hypothetical protein KC912_26520, partial [Proteobacteria bacterium]|nr:hypothetical protein [Pseudomonadota bacterium]
MIATANLGLVAIFAPLAVALLLAFSGPIRRTGVGAAALSLLAAVANLGAAGVLAARWWGQGDLVNITEWTWLIALGDTMATVGVHVDGVSAAMLAVVSVVALCVQIFSLSYLS